MFRRLKKVVNAALHETSYKYWMKERAAGQRVLQELPKKGITIIRWSDEDMRKLEEARMQVVAEMYVKDAPKYKGVLMDQFRFLESLGYDIPDKYMQ